MDQLRRRQLWRSRSPTCAAIGASGPGLALLHLVGTRHADAEPSAGDQTAKASSSNATATRWFTGSSTASSLCPPRSGCWHTDRCDATPTAAAPPTRSGSGRIAPWGDEHVDDLAELVDGSVDVAPPSGDLHVGFVDLPAIADAVAAGPGSLGQQGREALDPAVDRDVVDLDAAFGQQLLDVAVRQREAQVPAHGQHDHVGWEAEAGERSPYDRGEAGTASSHSDSLPALGSITADATVPRRRCPQEGPPPDGTADPEREFANLSRAMISMLD